MVRQVYEDKLFDNTITYSTKSKREFNLAALFFYMLIWSRPLAAIISNI